MYAKRIIPCLDIRDGKTVKGINFKGITSVGDPVEMARRYSEQMEETLYGNLKLMKGVLSQEQYRKYVTLINITHNNNNYLNNSLQLTDIYLAEKKP